MDITGACFCGEIRYRCEINPDLVGICHCRDCQVFSGSAFRMTCVVPPDQFTFTAGEPGYFDKLADSGKVRRMAFCRQCGTHLCSLPVEDEKGAFVSLRVATADQFAELTPRLEIFCDSKVKWLPPLKGSSEFSGMPG